MDRAKFQANPVKFLLNKAEDETELDKQAVEAPAFSLTKVLGTAALIVAPLATVLVEALGTIELNAPHYVALAIGLLGFLAVTTAADVLARSVVTAAEKKARAAHDAHFILFQEPLKARQQRDGEPPSSVWVRGARNPEDPEFLVTKKRTDSIDWRPQSEITSP